MKRLFLCVVSALLIVSACTPRSNEEIMTELVLKELINTPATYRKIDFRQIAEYTIKDEIDNRVEYFSTMVDSYTELSRSYPTTDMKKSLANYEAGLEEMKRLYDSYADRLQEVTCHEYELEYDAANEYGVPIRSYFQTRFNASGKMVGTKMGDKSWIPVGDFFSIPEYYDILDRFK